MNERDEMETAYHEAGHAVAALRLGLDFDGASIEPDHEAASLGRVAHAQVFTHLPTDHTEEDATRAVEDVVVMALAGLPAQRLVNKDCDPRGAASDEADAAELLARYGNPARLPALRERARQLVLDNRVEVYRVAKVLQALETIDAIDVEAAVNNKPISKLTPRGRVYFADHVDFPPPG